MERKFFAIGKLLAFLKKKIYLKTGASKQIKSNIC